MTLKEYRLRTGMTQEEVGRKLDVSAAAVCCWERGKNGILRKYHKKLAGLYGCTVDELLASWTKEE